MNTDTLFSVAVFIKRWFTLLPSDFENVYLVDLLKDFLTTAIKLTDNSNLRDILHEIKHTKKLKVITHLHTYICCPLN